MGGAIGTRAAARGLRGRMRRLVLNDNGPELAEAAIQRIRGYAGSPAAFATVSELEQYFRTSTSRTAGSAMRSGGASPRPRRGACPTAA